MKKHILFLVTEDWYFISHRLNFALYLIENGYKVSIACSDTGKFDSLYKYNLDCHKINWNRSSVSFLGAIKDLLKIVVILRKTKPTIFHLVSMRSILIGMLSSIFYFKTKVVLTFTGLGFIFIDSGFKKSFFRNIVRIYLYVLLRIKRNTSIVVQNKDDAKYLSKMLSLSLKKIFIVRGSGVNVDYFNVINMPINKPVVFSYVGRLIKDKGIETLFEAFTKLSKLKGNFKLNIAGSIDKKNPTSITDAFLKAFIKTKGVAFLGEVKDIRKVWKISHIAVLPSKREGLPMSLMEAAACGRAIIASDVAGCREIAVNKYNSLTFSYGNSDALFNAMLQLGSDSKLINKFGRNSRALVESDLSHKAVYKSYLNIYNNLF